MARNEGFVKGIGGLNGWMAHVRGGAGSDVISCQVATSGGTMYQGYSSFHDVF